VLLVEDHTDSAEVLAYLLKLRSELAGFSEHLVKPVGFEDLERAIKCDQKTRARSRPDSVARILLQKR
jgi:hypothetical protein